MLMPEKLIKKRLEKNKKSPFCGIYKERPLLHTEYNTAITIAPSNRFLKGRFPSREEGVEPLKLLRSVMVPPRRRVLSPPGPYGDAPRRESDLRRSWVYNY